MTPSVTHQGSSSPLLPARATGDFPDVARYREILSAFDLSKFPKLDKAMVKQVATKADPGPLHNSSTSLSLFFHTAPSNIRLHAHRRWTTPSP